MLSPGILPYSGGYSRVFSLIPEVIPGLFLPVSPVSRVISPCFSLFPGLNLSQTLLFPGLILSQTLLFPGLFPVSHCFPVYSLFLLFPGFKPPFLTVIPGFKPSFLTVIPGYSLINPGLFPVYSRFIPDYSWFIPGFIPWLFPVLPGLYLRVFILRLFPGLYLRVFILRLFPVIPCLYRVLL